MGTRHTWVRTWVRLGQARKQLGRYRPSALRCCRPWWVAGLRCRKPRSARRAASARVAPRSLASSSRAARSASPMRSDGTWGLGSLVGRAMGFCIQNRDWRGYGCGGLDLLLAPAAHLAVGGLYHALAPHLPLGPQHVDQTLHVGQLAAQLVESQLQRVRARFHVALFLLGQARALASARHLPAGPVRRRVTDR